MIQLTTKPARLAAIKPAMLRAAPAAQTGRQAQLCRNLLSVCRLASHLAPCDMRVTDTRDGDGPHDAVKNFFYLFLFLALFAGLRLGLGFSVASLSEA